MEEAMSNIDSTEELRNLWQEQRPESISISTEELRQASNRLTRRVGWRNIREYMAAIIVVAVYGYYFYKFHTFLLRLGSGLTIAGALFVVFQLYRKGTAAHMTMQMDANSCLEFHRSELVRQRELLSTVWRWYLMPFVPGISLFLFGLFQLSLGQSASRFHHVPIAVWFGVFAAVCGGTFVLIGWANQMAARQLERKIDALDALKRAPE
jgi:hypothetical protein